MVTQYGMSERFGLMGLESIENRYLDGRAVLNCGDTTAGQIDEEVMKILKVAYDKAVNLLRDNLEVLDKISAYLIEHETITGKEFMHIFNQVKGLPDEDTSDEEPSLAAAPKEKDPVLTEPKTQRKKSDDFGGYGPENSGDQPVHRVSMPDELGPGNQGNGGGHGCGVFPLSEENVWPPVKQPASNPEETSKNDEKMSKDDKTEDSGKDKDSGNNFISAGSIKD